MPPAPSSPTQAPSPEIPTTSLTDYTNIARAHRIFYLTPCLPLVKPAIYSLAFIILCYLFRRGLLYFHYPPAKSSVAWTEKQNDQRAASEEIHVDRADSSTQYQQRQSRESEEDKDHFSLWASLFALCVPRPSECEIVSLSCLSSHD